MSHICQKHFFKHIGEKKQFKKKKANNNEKIHATQFPEVAE